MIRYLLLPGAWAIGISGVALLARWPGATTDGAYPIRSVGYLLLSMTAEAGIVLAILQPGTYARSWGRALVAFVVSLAFILPLMGMHGDPPAYVSLFAWWTQMLSACLCVLFLWSGAASLPAQPPDEAPPA